MTLRRLQWLTIAAPLLFLAAVELIRRVVAPALLTSWPGYLLLGGVALFATLIFSEIVFGVVSRIQARQEQQNRELLALHEAGLDIAADLDLEVVLQRVVDRAAALVGARYGALALLADGGAGGGLVSFITTGISPEERARLGDPPAGHGLLGVVLQEGQRLRLDDMRQDPRAWLPASPPADAFAAGSAGDRARPDPRQPLPDGEGGRAGISYRRRGNAGAVRDTGGPGDRECAPASPGARCGDCRGAGADRP